MSVDKTINNQHVINISDKLAIRLRQLVDTYEKGNVSAFALLTNVKRTTLVECMQKKTFPSVNFIANIKNSLPDVDLNWLLNPSDSYRNTNLGDKIWLVGEAEVGYGGNDDSLRKELALTKENNATLKEYNDMLKGQVAFLKAELAKAQQQ
jgi:hypothetical protein